jgi:hypothetical protein
MPKRISRLRQATQAARRRPATGGLVGTACESLGPGEAERCRAAGGMAAYQRQRQGLPTATTISRANKVTARFKSRLRRGR